jgi:putative tryptophan/tyrosine transport system substrate-binding protein
MATSSSTRRLGGAAAWPLTARAQQQALPHQRRLGVLMGALPGDPGGQAEVGAFVKALAELGWVEGRNIAIAYRWSGADIALAEISANELMAFNPDILLARSTPPTIALQRATSTIPIVFVNVAEPISSGIVSNTVRHARGSWRVRTQQRRPSSGTSPYRKAWRYQEDRTCDDAYPS